MSVFAGKQDVKVGTWPDDGSPPTGVTVKPIRIYNVQKTNTVSRPKPAALTIENGTSLVHAGYDLYDSVVQRRVVVVATPVRKYGNEITTCSMHRPLGIYSDPLQYEIESRKITENKLRQKLANQSVNLANMLGEAKRSADLFVDLVKEVYRITMAVKHRDPRILAYGYYNPYGKLRKGHTGNAWLADLPRDISKQWLRYIYGVKPLMKDMHDAMVEIKTATDRSAPFIKVHATTRTKGQLIRSVTNSTWDSRVKCNNVQYSSKVVKGTAIARLRNDILKSSLGAYGFTNPLGVAWELTPFSFVVDWWINVGEVLQSLDYCLYIDATSLKAQFSERYEQVSTTEVLGQGALYRRWSYSRGNPSGISTINTLRIKTKPSMLHVANGTALLFTLLKR